MKVLTLLTVLFLSACTAVPITPKFPEAPKELTVQCKPLEQASTEAKLSDLTKTIVRNYSEYYQCSVLVDGWNEWYTKQKKIYEELK